MTIQKLIDSKADSAVSLVEVESSSHPMKMKKLEGDKVEAYCIPEAEGTRRQDLPVCYKRSAAVYAMKRELILNGALYGNFIVGHVVPKERSIDIDDAFDLMKAEHMLASLKEQGINF